MTSRTSCAKFLAILSSVLVLGQPMFAAPVRSRSKTTTHTTTKRKTTTHRYLGVPTYANSALGDVTEFDDPIIREASIKALGRYNGSVVAIDPQNGRVLSIVNQKLAFSSGYIPCSTIKPTIALAALQEGVVTRDTMIKVAPRRYMNLTEAMAHSNNNYFEELGRRMGFETVSHYAQSLGLGELAGYNIPEEQAGKLPAAPPVNGGVARMSSFGEGIQMTPLELGALVATVANGGTMYYLQYPRSEAAVHAFEPRVKRQLEIGPYVSDVRDGMEAAVLYGTAKRSFDADETLLGKTGTCSDQASHVGWFASYQDEVNPRLVLVILLRGQSSHVKGPFAAGIAGHIYHTLKEEDYFSKRAATAALARTAQTGTQR
jgi:penicillin-binding protein 2